MLEFAGFMLRACALVLDVIIAAAVILAAGFTFGDGSAGVIIVAILMVFVYPLLMPLTNWKGTLGKNHRAANRERRNIRKNIPPTGYCPLHDSVGACVLTFDLFDSRIYEEKQAVHDMAAKTIVLKAE